MNSKIIFILAIVLTAIGVYTEFYDVPLWEDFSPKSESFSRGIILGMGPALLLVAWVRWKKEKEEAAQ